MAARVNTKLILILTVCLFGAGGVIGGLWFLQMRGDASRAARIGDEFFAQGDLEKAKDYYQRAVGRAPGNLEYLQKLEDAILLFQPSTTDEAALWYNTWLTVLRQRAVNFPEDGVSQLRFLSELYHVSRRSNLPGYWQRLEDEAREMLVRMSQSDPHRPHAEILSNTARIRRGQSTLTLEELSEAEGKLIHAVSMIPHEDFAWAALLVSQNSISNRIKQSGQQLAGEEKTKELLENIEKAGQAVPEGLDTTRAILLSLGMLSGQESNITESLEEQNTQTEWIIYFSI
ncbi:MAG: tetratricopeptide repeat protein [Planctomycetes bacterium]|nr:tetratricopeptide repeat protein [Planctomycetota bacterium]